MVFKEWLSMSTFPSHSVTPGTCPEENPAPHSWGRHRWSERPALQQGGSETPKQAKGAVTQPLSLG